MKLVLSDVGVVIVVEDAELAALLVRAVLELGDVVLEGVDCLVLLGGAEGVLEEHAEVGGEDVA